MFEFSVMKRFLSSGGRKSSTGLITFISLFVIASIVWLTLVFFSVMDGIEARWLEKFTILHPPLRVIPTATYYSSYYYNIDTVSSKSGYSTKSLREKLASDKADPYLPDRDMEIPAHWAPPIYKENGELRDLACDARDVIGKVCLSYANTEVSDYEMGAALLHLTTSEGPISQIAYLGSFPDCMKSFSRLEISPNTTELSTLLLQNHHGRSGVVLPSHFQSNGVSIGDNGYISYSMEGGFTLQENRAPIYVAGFYDPGPISIGMNYLFVPQNIIDSVKASPVDYLLDTSRANGFGIWTHNLHKTVEMQHAIEKELQNAKLDRFWKVSHFSEYPFIKNLMQQFQSDRYLFSLVSGLILLVACSNICSLLILLINNKKKEIAILTVMGASKGSIVAIFSACGLSIGLFSTGIGLGLASITIRNISPLIRGISALQGHPLLDPALYQSLPKNLSLRASLFVSIATPLCATLASLIPLLTLRHIDPKETLQS